MHADVQKFWEKDTYKVIVDILQDDFWTFYWTLIDKEGFQIEVVGKSDPQLPGTKSASCSIYYFKDRFVTEHVMLKIIKLRAFL